GVLAHTTAALCRGDTNRKYGQPYFQLCIQPNSPEMKLFLFYVLFAASVCNAQSSATVPKPPWAKNSAADRASSDGGDDSSFKVDVKLVNIFVTVTDEHGAPVGNLNKDNFQIFEDGHPEKISVFGKESELPLSIVLDIDTSLSTRKDLPLELASARRFAHAILRPVDALSLYQFSEIVSEVTPFTSDLRRIDHAIDRVHVGSATALYDALYLGAGALESRQGRKVMVVITDGGDTMSKVDYKEAVRAAQQAE